MILDLNKVPTKPWVYIWKNKNKVLYVGKAKNLKSRLSQYFRTWVWAWKQEMVGKATNVDWIITDNEEEALLLENQLIKKYNPPYNSLLKWDTWYTYIRIWEWDFPKIEFTRYKDKPGIYMWPKPWKKDLKDILRILRQILKFRTCSDTKFKKWKICSDYIMWLCKGRCDLKSNKEEVISNKFDYSKITKLIVDYFKGDAEPIKNLIKEKIEQAVENQNFEYAAKLRDIYFKLDKFINKQIIEINQPITGYFVRIRPYNWWYFMVYVYLKDWKIIDVVKLKDTENNFIQTMKQDWLIKNCVEIEENFRFCEALN